VNAKLLIVAAAAVAVPEGALAQRTAENLVTQSADAFGKTIGNEKIGLYSTEDIRGFNPIDAGNVRIEGLYFDHVERVPTRLVEGSTVRVGVAAQGFSFPAPTGIVDYDLTLYRGKFEASGMIERGPYGGAAGNVELKVPISGDILALPGALGSVSKSGLKAAKTAIAPLASQPPGSPIRALYWRGSPAHSPMMMMKRTSPSFQRERFCRRACNAGCFWGRNGLIKSRGR